MPGPKKMTMKMNLRPARLGRGFALPWSPQEDILQSSDAALNLLMVPKNFRDYWFFQISNSSCNAHIFWEPEAFHETFSALRFLSFLLCDGC